MSDDELARSVFSVPGGGAADDRTARRLATSLSPRSFSSRRSRAVSPVSSRPEYCVAKAGLSMVAQLFAARLAGQGIRVYEIRPGLIETEMTRGVHESYSAKIAEGLDTDRAVGNTGGRRPRRRRDRQWCVSVHHRADARRRRRAEPSGALTQLDSPVRFNRDVGSARRAPRARDSFRRARWMTVLSCCHESTIRAGSGTMRSVRKPVGILSCSPRAAYPAAFDRYGDRIENWPVLPA